MSGKEDLKTYRLPPQRVCTDCGKPTNNFRCDACWQEKRGIVPEAASESFEFTKNVFPSGNGYTAAMIAEKAGVEAKYVSNIRWRIMRGYSPQTATAERVRAVCRELGIELKDLVPGWREPQKREKAV